jgi:hypothetical protein
MIALSKPRNLSRRNPCHSFASAKSGSTQTFRFRIAFWYRLLKKAPTTGAAVGSHPGTN